MKHVTSMKLLMRLAEGLPPARFPLGKLHVTPGVRDILPMEKAIQSLQRHATGDWGDIGKTDWEQNERSLISGRRLFSAYRAEAGRRVWVITEADRSSTTILLPEEY